MVWGTAIFTLGSISCMIAKTIDMMILARFIQGIGASAGDVVIYAMVADLYSEEKAARLFGLMNAILVGAMAGAPILGSFIVGFYNWRGNFIIVAVLAVVTLGIVTIFFPESHPERQKIDFKEVIRNYATLLTNRRYMVYTMGPAMMVGAYMIYVASAPFLFIETLGLSYLEYGINLGLVLVSFAVVSLFTGRINAYFGMSQSIYLSAVICVTANAVMVGLVMIFEPAPWWITSLMCITAAGAALCFGSAIAICLSVNPAAKGAAAAGNICLRVLAAALCVYFGGLVYNGSFAPILTAMLVCQILATGLLITELRREKQAIASQQTG